MIHRIEATWRINGHSAFRIQRIAKDRMEAKDMVCDMCFSTRHDRRRGFEFAWVDVATTACDDAYGFNG